MVAERLRKTIESKKVDISKIDNDKKYISVTISLGVAQYDGTMDCNEFIRKADNALYEAKETGRNKVVVSE